MGADQNFRLTEEALVEVDITLTVDPDLVVREWHAFQKALLDIPGVRRMRVDDLPTGLVEQQVELFAQLAEGNKQ